MSKSNALAESTATNACAGCEPFNKPMIKPDSFLDLPACLQERFLWECDLDYCHYESSMAEAVHSIMCNYPYEGSTNDLVIKSTYAMLSPEKLAIWVRSELESAKATVEIMQKMLTETV